jgi:hypothetical protein
MNKFKTLTIIASLLFLYDCSSTSTNIMTYDKSSIDTIKQWCITFTYEVGQTEEKVTSGGTTEKTIKKSQHGGDLQLLDDIFYNLKNKKFPIFKNEGANCGVIKLHTMRYFNFMELYESVDITIFDKNNNLIYRIKIKNGGGMASPLKNDEMAEYISNILYKLIIQKVNPSSI